MMFSVMIEPYNDQFAATFLGALTIRTVGATRDAALSALHANLAQRLAQGQFHHVGGLCAGGHRPRRPL